MKIALTPDELNVVRDRKHVIKNMGLNFKLLEDSVEVSSVPTCFWNKFVKNVIPKYEFCICNNTSNSFRKI